MTVFFNGRQYISPTTMSVVNDSAMYGRGASVGNVVALLGKSEGGKPFTALRFGSPSEARSVLRSGELLKAVELTFDPSSDTVSPATVIAIRVDPATQAALTLKDAATNDVIALASTDYGLHNNQIKVKVEAGSTKGKKLTVANGTGSFSKDNVFRDAFTCVYNGAQATATITVSESSVVLAAPAGSTVATIPLSSFPTVGALVERINAVTDFSAVVLDGNGEKLALASLDAFSAQSVKTIATVTANLQACIDWFNSAGEGFVNAARSSGAGAAPANIGYTYLSSAVDGAVTTTEWQSGFDALQAEDAQWVVPVSSDDAVHAMTDTHCAYMSNVAQKERRSIVGTTLATSDASALTKAKALNSDRTSLTHIGIYDYNSAGVLTLYAPYLAAAMIAGAFSGVNPGTAMTNKSLKIRGVERKLRNPTDTDGLITGGVLCIEDSATGYRVVKSVTTWLNNSNYNRVEISVGVALDFVSRAIRNTLDGLKGAKANPQTLAEAVSRADTVLRELSVAEPIGPGVLAGDEANPPFRGLTASIAGDVLQVTFQCSPVIPVNYIPVSIYAVPWSGSASI